MIFKSSDCIPELKFCIRNFLVHFSVNLNDMWEKWYVYYINVKLH